MFVGEPLCACCRTASRIRALLETGELSPSVEQPALAALRHCVGALTDLLEDSTGAPAGRVVPRHQPAEAATSVSGALAPKAAEEESKETEPNKEESDKAEEKKAKKSKPKERKEKTHKRKKKEASKKAKKETEENSGAEPALILRENDGAREGDREEEESPPRAASSKSKPSRPSEATGEEQEEREQEEPKEVFRVRGSVCDHFERVGLIDPRTTRPREPEGPPPRGRTERRREEAPRRRSRSRRRGTKGSKHSERGRVWGHPASRWRRRQR